MRPDSWGLQIGQRGSTVRRLMGHLRPGFREGQGAACNHIAASLHHVAPSGELLEPRRLLDAYESTAPEPLTRDEHRWLPGALALIPLHWAATAGLLGDGIRDAESAMTAAEAWWSHRA